MGLRSAASVGSPDVVMAPALTETQQSQSFNFASSVALSLKDHRKVSERVSESVSVSENAEGMNGRSPPTKTTYSINGLVKNLKNEFLSINSTNEDVSQNMSDMGHLRGKDDDVDNDDFKGLVISNDDLATPENELGQEEVEELLSTLKPVVGFEFEKDFLDVINMSDDMMGLVGVPSKDKETLISERIENSKKCLHQFHRRRAFMLQRLRKLEGTFLGKHVSEEITGLIEYCTGLLETANRGGSRVEPGKRATFAGMSLFMRQVDHAATSQANAAGRAASKNFKYFGSGSSGSPLASNGLRTHGILPALGELDRRELEVVAAELSAQQRKVLEDFDSDATESSSGGESADEMIPYTNPQQHPLSINKRCLWRWAEDRASIASRWVWLQSQIADLDYKIRQVNDIRRQIKTNKGPVKLENSPPSECVEETCARVRPLIRSSFTKRKVVTLSGSLRGNKRAGRPSSVRCSCRGVTLLSGGMTEHSCGLCAGRLLDPTGPRDPLEMAPVNERVALLDPGFHPQLSFSSDVSQSLHYNAILRTPEWQARASRILHRVTASTSADVSPEQTSRGRKPTSIGLAGGGSVVLPSLPPHPTPVVSGPSTSAMLQDYHIDAERSRAAVVAVASKVRRKNGRGGGRRGRRNHVGGNDRVHKRRKFSSMYDGRDYDGVDMLEDGSDSLHLPVSPVPSPASATSKDKEMMQLKRKRENSYDIDNIVIPYSMAAATRTEMLKYKEILTPKWRRLKDEHSAVNTVEHKNGVVRRPSHDVECHEDLSDEAFVCRHDRCEIDEKKKFLSYMKRNAGAGSGAQAGPGGRGRGRARTDSRAESSGPNTPDPMSPDPTATADSLTSPPATPAPPDDPPAPSSSTSLSSASRRRTVSSSKVGVPEIPQSQTYVEYIPEGSHYEPRKFPLSDEEYKKMLMESSEGSSNCNFSDSISKIHNSLYELESLYSPRSVSTDSADSMAVEDPNDPEWTSTEGPGPRR